MNFLRFVALAALMLYSPILFPQDTSKWSLERCIDYALKNNIQIRQTEIAARISFNENLQSKLNLLPSVEGNLTYSNNFGNGVNLQTYSFSSGNSQSGQVSLQGSLPVFTGLQQFFNIERTRYELLASKFDYESSQRNIALSVASAYLQILLNKEILKVAEKQKQLSDSQRTNVLAKIKSGSLPEISGFEIESQLARDEANAVAAQNAVSLGLLSLRQLLQINDEKFDIELPEISFDKVEDVAAVSALSVYDFALGNQPEIKGAEARVKSANASRKISIGALSPTIVVFGNLSSGYFSQDRRYEIITDTIFGIPIPSQSDLGPKSFNDQLNDNFRKAIGFSVSVSLFSKWQKVTNIQSAKLQMQIRELQLQGTKNQLRQDIELAYTNAKAAVQSYLANKKSMEAADKSFNAFEKRYNAGMLSNYELQQSKNTLAVAESEMLKAKYTYVFRLKVLDFYQGKPLKLGE